MARQPETFIVTFEAGPDPRPAVTRLRQLLKFAGRAMRLRCVKVSSAGGTEISPGRRVDDEVNDAVQESIATHE